MSNAVWVVQTSLPGEWIEAEVGSTESTEEWRVEIKTSQSKKDRLIEEILDNHPYETPQIVAWEAISTPGYSDWVQG